MASGDPKDDVPINLQASHAADPSSLAKVFVKPPTRMSADKNTTSDIWLAGAIAAFSVDLLVYPLDTLKTRLQSPDYKRLYTKDAAGSVVNKAKLFRGLYQGVGSVIIATLPSSGAFFTTYEGCKHLLSTHNPTFKSSPLLPAPLIHATASSIAELVSCAILTPAEVIKQNAQMVQGSSSTNATMQTLSKFRSNPLALWRGYTALASRNLPFTALQFPMFERLKDGIRRSRERSGKATGMLVESGLVTAVSAGTAGAISAVVTTPIDVVKTRIMLAAADSAVREVQGTKEKEKSTAKAAKDGLVDAMGNVGKRDKKARKGSWQIAKEVWREGGMKGLWRGGALRSVWTFLGSGLYLGVYESGRIYLASRRGEKVDEDGLL